MERRRRESRERRERFIRQPLENIIRQRAAAQVSSNSSANISSSRNVVQHQDHWGSLVRKSILKHRPEVRWAQHWLTNTGRHHVRFQIQRTPSHDTVTDCGQDSTNDEDDDDEDDDYREKLPVLPLEEASRDSPRVVLSSSSRIDDNQMRRLPPLLSTESEMDVTRQSGGPSWVERQVAKVKKRKLWAQQQEQQKQMNNVPPIKQQRHPIRILKRTVSLLVNVSDECDTDSLDGCDSRRAADKPVEIQKEEIKRSLAWDVMLDKAELQQEKRQDPPSDEPYGGWADFPHRLAEGIAKRQAILNERKTLRKEKMADEAGNNSFVRRKIFSKSLLMAVIRLRSRKAAAKKASASAVAQTTSSIPSPLVVEMSNPASLPDIPEETDTPKSTGEPPSSEVEDFKAAGSIEDEAATDDGDPSMGICNNNPAIETEPDDNRHSPVLITCSPADDIKEIEEEVIVISVVVSASCDGQLDGRAVYQEPFVIATRMEEADVTLSIRQDPEKDPTAVEPCLDDMMADSAADDDGNDDAAPCGPISIVGLSFLPEKENIPDADSISFSSDAQGRVFDEENNLAAAAVIPADPVPGRIDSDGPPPLPVIGNLATPSDPIPSVAAACESDVVATVSSVTGAQSGEDALPDSRVSSRSSSGLGTATPPISSIFRQDALVIPWDEDPLSSRTGDATWSMASAASAPISNLDIPPTDSDHFEDQSSDGQLDTVQPIPIVPLGVDDDDWQPPESSTLLDKKTKEARNAWRMHSVTMSTQTDPLPPPPPPLSPPVRQEDKGVGELESAVKSRGSSAGSSNGDAGKPEECRCLHRAVLTCLLPEAAETLANLELIRRQLKKARLRQQQPNNNLKLQQQQRRQQPLAARVGPTDADPTA